MELEQLTRDLALGMMAADAKRPVATSQRTGRVYQAGIGPHSEDRAVDLTVAEMRERLPGEYAALRCRVSYPGTRRKCDLVVGDPAAWAIEIKMARFRGDNGKEDDTSIKDVLSPFDRDRSLVADCTKLVKSSIAPRLAVLLYGFEDELRPLDQMIDAFEVLAGTRVRLGRRLVEKLDGLVHPVFSKGRVFAWEILPR